MRGYIHSVHPAGAAIAAVLALGSTYSFAQEVPAAPEAAADTVIVPPPPVASPALSPAQPMVQPTASVEDRLNAAVAASETETASNPAKRAAAPAESSARSRKAADPVRAASRPEPVRAVTAQPVERAETPPVAVPARDPAPMATPAEVAPVAAVTPAQPDEARAADSGTDEALLWALGGGALLLAGLGGAVAMRRRRVRTEVEQDDLAMPAAAPVASVERAPMSEPALNRAFVAMPVAAGAASGSSLEAMVAAPPSAENPFRTHRKRMVRARFLLAQQEKREQAAHADQRAPVPPQTIHAEPQMQTIYRMGGDRNRRMTFKPQTR